MTLARYALLLKTSLFRFADFRMFFVLQNTHQGHDSVGDITISCIDERLSLRSFIGISFNFIPCLDPQIPKVSALLFSCFALKFKSMGNTKREDSSLSLL